MIETAARRRAVGDWRGACAAADVDVFFNSDSVRRLHGAAAAESLAADLRTLAPDLLRWQLPRCGHGAGRLLEGLLIPLAEYGDGDAGPGTTLTLAAATPGFALAAGERIVLTLLEGRVRRARGAADPATSAVLSAVRRRSADRHDLRRHRMFWDARCAPQLRALCSGVIDNDDAILLMQDEGRAVEAWTAAGWDVAFGAASVSGPGPGAGAGAAATATAQEERRLRQWLAALPVNLPQLAQRVREALPASAGQALIRCGGGTLVLSGFADGGRRRAEVVPPRYARALRAETPVVPDAAWVRPIDADLLRLGVLTPRELHPLVASALGGDGAAAEPAALGEWRYSTTLGIEAQYADTLADRRSVVLVRCGDDLHRVARIDGRWQVVDHDEHQAREMLLGRLGGPLNPCRTAAAHLGDGRHVIELVARLLEHGRVTEATSLLREHADTVVAPEQYLLPDGSTVGQVLDQLRQNALRLHTIRAGAPPPHDSRSTRIPPPVWLPRRSRKERPARSKTPR